MSEYKIPYGIYVNANDITNKIELLDLEVSTKQDFAFFAMTETWLGYPRNIIPERFIHIIYKARTSKQGGRSLMASTEELCLHDITKRICPLTESM